MNVYEKYIFLKSLKKSKHFFIFMENNCSSLLKSVNLVRGPERVRDPAVPPAVPGSALRGADDEGFGGEGAAWEAAEEGGCHRGGGCTQEKNRIKRR